MRRLTPPKPPNPPSFLGASLGTAVGLILAGWLLHSFGVGRILALLEGVGLTGALVFSGFHLSQVVFSALAWRIMLAPGTARPTLASFCVLRWIREGVNNLLPVAQIGGEFVTASLLRRRGVPLTQAVAGTIADLTIEMVTQIVFTLMGLAILLRGGKAAGVEASIVSGLVVATLAAAGFLAAQWFGLAAAIEAGLLRLGRALGWAEASQVEGLQAALRACYRAPRRSLGAALAHLISWLLGAMEVCIGLHFLGHDVGIGAGLAIEAVGQALKAAGFAVPGALGVQEGGYILVCGLFGLAPPVGIALSLMKRLREVALGVPAIAAWRLDARRLAAPAISLGAGPLGRTP